MKNKKPVLITASVIIIIVLSVILYQTVLQSDTTLELTVQDSISGFWVWDLEIILGDNIIHGYFQSDRGAKPFRFINIIPGDYVLKLSAPDYTSQSIPVKVKRGKNIISESFKMEGIRIPELDRFLVFEELAEDNFLMNLRPVSTIGRAIINHPCIDLWIGCRVSEQMVGNEPAREKIEDGAARGKELYRGRLNWVWDPSPDVQFRYYSGISLSDMQSSNADFFVFDYLVLIPVDGKIENTELSEIIEKAWLIQDHTEFIDFLMGYKEKFSFYIDTSWNVRSNG